MLPRMMTRMSFCTLLVVAACTAAVRPLVAEPAEAPQTGVWDLTDLYPSEAAWEEARERVTARVDGLTSYRGTLGDSAQAMLEALTEISDTRKEATRLLVYANLKNDEDQRVTESQARLAKARTLAARAEEATAWTGPEILKVGEATVERFIEEEPGLQKFAFVLRDVLRRAPHTLSDEGEELMAQASLVLSAPYQIYSLFANADIPWPTITLSTGEEATLTQAVYTRYRSAPNRDDRKKVFDAFFGTWKQYADGLGGTLDTEVQSNVFQARARRYESVLQQNLFADALPREVYTTLVEEVNAALPVFQRYLKLRGRMLGIDDLRYYDLYPPLVETGEKEVFDLERSRKITLEALRPLGAAYLSELEHGLSQHWMHSHPQPGKQSGAYMEGDAYDVHPYLLLNHNDDYESLTTFAHEWGHAVHTVLAAQANPWETYSYSTFIAEMASTINEILLQEYMIAHARSNEEKLFYLGQAVESLRTTLFRQTMFAEFELRIHETVERGEPLTGARMTEIYRDLLERYHGHNQGVLTIDALYAHEWEYIPHFYLDFYVFQYATSISGAAWFAEQFLAGDEAVRDAFLRVLKAGGSDYPHEILVREAGLDMTGPDAYRAVIRRMTSLLDRIEVLLDEEGD
jgi:oligoendopeptidase F